MYELGSCRQPAGSWEGNVVGTSVVRLIVITFNRSVYRVGSLTRPAGIRLGKPEGWSRADGTCWQTVKKWSIWRCP